MLRVPYRSLHNGPVVGRRRMFLRWVDAQLPGTQAVGQMSSSGPKSETEKALCKVKFSPCTTVDA